MPNPDLSILIVDDAKFSSAIIAKTLRKAGYQDLRIATHAATALQMLKERTVSVLLADWLMPEMDGLEMTEHVRKLDADADHFTYVILLTAKEGVEALAVAFNRGVDDFIHKSQISKQLLPRIYAAERLAATQNTLLAENRLLLNNNLKLVDNNLLDAATGLGNQKMARARLTDMLRQTESRGGATNYMLIRIKNWPEINRCYKREMVDDLAKGIAKRLQHLTRPLDTVCRISADQYAIISQFSDIEQCTVSCFKRVSDGINLKAISTRAGFIGVNAVSSVCAIDASMAIPELKHIEKVALHRLQYAADTGRIAVSRWPEMAAEEIAIMVNLDYQSIEKRFQ